MTSPDTWNPCAPTRIRFLLAISELRQALNETGLQPDDQVELTYTLKADFKRTSFPFHEALVFSTNELRLSAAGDTKLPAAHPICYLPGACRISQDSIMDFFGRKPAPRRTS